MNWLDRIIPPKIKGARDSGSGVPKGLWRKCNGCQAVLYAEELVSSFEVCPKCGHHHRIGGPQRLKAFFGEHSFQLLAEEVAPQDALKFRDLKKYKDRLSEASRKSNSSEALVVAKGLLIDQPVVVAAFDFSFMGGSMGAVVGERFVRAVGLAIKERIPFICFSASGGARMQEGLFSLMQLGKTVAALKRLKGEAIPYISVLTDPTMGGVSASFAMLGDVIIAEPEALVGFAGQRVIEQTVREKLPEGFQRAEFLLDHGSIDMILARSELPENIHRLLSTLYFEPRAQQAWIEAGADS
ncbi:MAG: acetyl-CoA carboxylase carboxyltransferase subunit beta [Proteobacteria bacterium]|nr:acetyl-CoA carboxylase carboxyltransferase subunit beta [Pseudomonadota bacterium]